MWPSITSDALKRRAWASAGAPILALVAFVCLLALGLLLNFASQQDKAFEANSRQLVVTAIEARLSAVGDLARDYAEWDDAYQAVTRRWDAAWLESNYYSTAAEVVLVVRDGEVRYSWVAEDAQNNAGALTSAVVQNLRSVTPQRESVSTALNLGGALALMGVSPITLEDHSAPIRDYIVLVQRLDAPALAALGQSLSLEGLQFTANAPRGDVVTAPVGGANLMWRHERPGSASFSDLILPSLLLVMFAGACAWLVARTLVEKQIAARAAQEAALESSRLKSEFIASMSHELRTPLNAIIGYAELIREEAGDGDTAALQTDAARILTAARHLTGLVSDILDQSKIDAGRIMFRIEPLVLPEILGELAEITEPLIQANDNSLTVDLSANIPPVLADHGRLQQCLLNLVGNAAKFTRGGTITVMPRTTLINGRPMVAIDVTDTGIGIGAEELAGLFKPFTQANTSVQARYGGAGLGLSISRKLARAMEGDVIVESEKGVGSTFTLLVPAAGGVRLHEAAA